MVAALLRLFEPRGVIRIDGVDTGTLSLKVGDSAGTLSLNVGVSQKTLHKSTSTM